MLKSRKRRNTFIFIFVSMDKIKYYKNIVFILTIIIISLFISIIGHTFNFVAMVENQGKMPVLIEHKGILSNSEYHFIYNDKSEVNYWYLTDIFKINKFYYSLGDITMLIGVIISLFAFLKTITLLKTFK